jgi:hypothetical protein
MAQEPEPAPPRKPSRRWRRVFLFTLLGLSVVLLAVRLMLPSIVRNYVIDAIDRTSVYQGEIGAIDIHLYRGAYSIRDVRISKVTGNVPAPLFAAERVDLAVQWDALMRGSVVGRITMFKPELNFVDSESDSGDQTGAGGPWLEIVRGLFPFKIDSARVVQGSVHFRAAGKDVPVDVFLSQVEATVENLTNIDDETTPLISTIKATAVAMDHARFEYEMKLDPFSYRPTFQMAVRLLSLDVTKINDLARAYGSIDFESGWFDLVIEMDAKEGAMEGYVKPLFRNLQVFSLTKDSKEGDPLRVFWEAVVGATAKVLSNPRRDQFGTVIPFRGDVTGPQTDVLSTIGNVLRNAFVRAYLPRLQGRAPDINDLRFSPGTIADPISAGG